MDESEYNETIWICIVYASIRSVPQYLSHLKRCDVCAKRVRHMPRLAPDPKNSGSNHPLQFDDGKKGVVIS